MNVRRGDIFWADVTEGTGLHKERLVLIIQNDRGNKFSNQTIIAPIRHDAQKELPIHVSLNRGMAGLKKDSVIDCALITAIYKDQLRDYQGHLPDLHMHQVNKALKISLALT